MKKKHNDALVNLERIPTLYHYMNIIDFRKEVSKLSGVKDTRYIDVSPCTHYNSTSRYKATVIDEKGNCWIYFFYPSTINGQKGFGIGRKITHSKDEGSMIDSLGHLSYGSLTHNPFANAFSRK